MKRTLYLLLAAALLPSVFLWGHKKSLPTVPGDLRDAPISSMDQLGVREPGGGINTPPAPVPVAVDANASSAQTVGPAAKDWTVLVYINAKNNLESAGLYNVNDMEKVGSTDNMNVVVEFGRMSGQRGDTAADGDWTGVRRYFITRDNDPGRITSPFLAVPGNTDMGDYRNAAEFLRWGKRKFPARKYLFIMWNHGGGWLAGISSDDETRHIINAQRIGEVLRAGGGADVLAFDACLMQMAEVAYEVKDSARVVVGSEETIPGMGYPYSAFLRALAGNPGMDAEALGAVIVAAYGSFYTGYSDYNLGRSGDSDLGVTLSAIRTGKLSELAARMKEFGQLAAAAGDANALRIAKKQATRYGAMGSSDRLYIKSPYVDLHSFVRYYGWQADRSTAKGAAAARSADGLKDFIERSLVIRNFSLGVDPLGLPLTDSHGVAAYLPPASPSMTRAKIDRMANVPYADLEFNRQSDWLNFVIMLFGIELNEGRDLPPVNNNVQFS